MSRVCELGVEHRDPWSTRYGFVYAMAAQSVGLVKIGATNNPVVRFAQMSNFSPVPLTITRILWVGGRREATVAESTLHQHLARFLSHSEWYHDGAQIADAFDEICPAVDATDGFASNGDFGRGILGTEGVEKHLQSLILASPRFGGAA